MLDLHGLPFSALPNKVALSHGKSASNEISVIFSVLRAAIRNEWYKQ
jgi:hypothetical protein